MKGCYRCRLHEHRIEIHFGRVPDRVKIKHLWLTLTNPFDFRLLIIPLWIADNSPWIRINHGENIANLKHSTFPKWMAGRREHPQALAAKVDPIGPAAAPATSGDHSHCSVAREVENAYPMAIRSTPKCAGTGIPRLPSLVALMFG